MADRSELLLEVGTEELPASFVEKARRDLQGAVVAGLEAAGFERFGRSASATPRRLIVGVYDLPTRQEDSVRRTRGPAVKGAFTPEGTPTPALLGFCRGQGIAPEAIENDGQYVWADVPLPGRPTRDILAEILPQAILSLTFPTTM
ncbi:MAG: glycine--tRNA ligase subunit beta, partial [Chloroflexota bacterium]